MATTSDPSCAQLHGVPVAAAADQPLTCYVQLDARAAPGRNSTSPPALLTGVVTQGLGGAAPAGGATRHTTHYAVQVSL